MPQKVVTLASTLKVFFFSIAKKFATHLPRILLSLRPLKNRSIWSHSRLHRINSLPLHHLPTALSINGNNRFVHTKYRYVTGYWKPSEPCTHSFHFIFVFLCAYVLYYIMLCSIPLSCTRNPFLPSLGSKPVEAPKKTAI